MKVREIIKILNNDGWYLDRTRGSHKQFKHSIKRGLVTISGNNNDDVAIGTLKSIIKQAGLEDEKIFNHFRKD
jgi:predicted RNA binding protein YcfA (HicA-like mRNA interferase family)